MNSITFDTLNYSNTLQEAGMPREQAEAFAKAQKIAFDEMIATRELATKTDLKALENKIIIWVVGTAIAQTALLLAIVASLS